MCWALQYYVLCHFFRTIAAGTRSEFDSSSISGLIFTTTTTATAATTTALVHKQEHHISYISIEKKQQLRITNTFSAKV